MHGHRIGKPPGTVRPSAGTGSARWLTPATPTEARWRTYTWEAGTEATRIAATATVIVKVGWVAASDRGLARGQHAVT